MRYFALVVFALVACGPPTQLRIDVELAANVPPPSDLKVRIDTASGLLRATTLDASKLPGTLVVRVADARQCFSLWFDGGEPAVAGGVQLMTEPYESTYGRVHLRAAAEAGAPPVCLPDPLTDLGTGTDRPPQGDLAGQPDPDLAEPDALESPDFGTGGEGYKITRPTLTFVNACNLSGTKDLEWENDSTTPLQPLPFPFLFFGSSVSSFWVSTNGVLGFDNQPYSKADFTCPLPAAINSRPSVLAYAADLRTTEDGVCIAVTGTAPSRRLVATWSNASRQAGDNTETFSVVLHETTNVIELLYKEMDDTGANAVIGLIDATGTKAAQLACKQANAARSGTAVRFTP